MNDDQLLDKLVEIRRAGLDSVATQHMADVVQAFAGHRRAPSEDSQVAMLKDQLNTLAATNETLRQNFDDIAKEKVKAEAIGRDHARTIQMLRDRIEIGTERRTGLEAQVRRLVNAADIVRTEHVARGKIIEKLQRSVERYRKRGNALAEVARKAEKESYRDNYFDACATIVSMYEAGTGRKINAPPASPVEDLAMVQKDGAAVMRCLERIVAKVRERCGKEIGTNLVRLVCAEILSDIKTILDEEGAPKPVTDGHGTKDGSGWSTEVQWAKPPDAPKTDEVKTTVGPECEACGFSTRSHDPDCPGEADEPEDTLTEGQRAKTAGIDSLHLLVDGGRLALHKTTAHGSRRIDSVSCLSVVEGADAAGLTDAQRREVAKMIATFVRTYDSHTGDFEESLDAARAAALRGSR